MSALQADYIELRLGQAGVLPPVAASDRLAIGDHVEILFEDEQGELPARGMIAEVFRGDRFKVEVLDEAGEIHRYSAPRDLLRLVRRAEA